MTSWVVRAGREGNEEQNALESNVITIGWNELPDLSNIDNKGSLETLFRKYHPDYSIYKISSRVTQIWNFIKRIRKDDFVAIPLKSENSEVISIGVVVGDYQYKEIADEVKHIRQVKWLKQVPISEFEQDLWRYFWRPSTVFILNKKVDNHISNLLSGLVEAKDRNDNKKTLKLTRQTLPDIISEFKNWYATDAARKHIITIEKEKQEVKDLMKKLDTIDKDSSEFVDWVQKI